MTLTEDHRPDMGRWSCPCPACRAHRQASQNEYRAKTNRARNPLFTDASAVPELLEPWHRYGYTDRAVGAVLGISPDSVRWLRMGRSKRTYRTTIDGIGRLTHHKLIAATPDTSPVPSIGATRRVRALYTQGWTLADIPLPHTTVEVYRQGSHPTMLAGRHRSLDALYRSMLLLPPPATWFNTHRRAGADWAPPAAWTPTSIDDPDAVPYEGAALSYRERQAAEKLAFVEDVEFLLQTEPVDRVCKRLGVTMAAADLRLRRAGRHDLARPFNNEVLRQKQQREAS